MNALFDPLHNQQAPRRYAVESDSENSSYEGEVSTHRSYAQEQVTLRGEVACTKLYVAFGAAGEVWSSAFDGEEIGQVSVEGQVGSFVRVDQETVALQAEGVSLSTMCPFVEAVLQACTPTRYFLPLGSRLD